MSFNEKKYKNLKENLNTIWKRVQRFEKEPLTSNLELLREYKEDLVSEYNKIILYLKPFETETTDQGRKVLLTAVDYNLIKLKRGFEAIRLEYDWSTHGTYDLVDISKLKPASVPSVSTDQTLDTENTNSQDSDKTLSNVEETPDDQNLIETDDESDTEAQNLSIILNNSLVINEGDEENTRRNNTPPTNNGNIVENAKMPQSANEFMKLAGSIINYKYNGDPTKLESFLVDIELVQELAEEEQKDLCLKFIRSRVEDTALECVKTHTIEKVEDIVNALKSEFKNDSSTVVEGRILALRLEKGNYQKFTKNAEELAESYRRSLVDEGIPRPKAKQMTVQKTVELCAQTARAEQVKTVLWSTKFDTVQEVLARFITQTNIVRKEKQEAESYQNRKQLNKNSNKGGNNNRNFNRNDGNNRNQNQNQNNRNNNGYRNNNNNGNNNGGNQRNNRNNGGNNRNGNNRNYNNRSNEHTIRLVQGNAQGPSNGGAPQNQQETIHHLPLN